MSSPRIVCLGEALLEFNEQTDGSFISGFGGDTSNCAIAAARQGTHTGYITRIGKDAFGDKLENLWIDEGVDIATVKRDDSAPTGIYFVSHDCKGHHFTYYRAGSAASLMTPQCLDAQYIEQSEILHISAISQAISQSANESVSEAIAIARRSGVTVSYDTNLRLNLWPIERARSIIHDTASRADILLPGMDDATSLTGLTHPEKIVDYYLSLGAKIVALTLGADGVLVADAGHRQYVPAVKVNSVDATGAGDTFDGAFLAQWLRTKQIVNAAEFANIAAAMSTTGFGAVTPIPRRKDVELYLSKST